MEKITMTPQLLLQKLAGKRIVLCGRGEKRDAFVQNLTHMIEQNKADVVLLGGAEKTQAGDYVLLFGETDDAAGAGLGHTELLVLASELQSLAKTKPQSTVFVSDYMVYGKCFGETKARKEKELGYVSHTSKTEISIQNLRMAEHLICRLAREEGVNIKVVRTGAELSAEDTERAVQKVLVSVLQVLLDGVRGEIYNLPGCSGNGVKNDSGINVGEGSGSVKQTVGMKTGQNGTSVWDEKRSPLSSMEIVPDTEKFEKLVNLK